MMKRASLTFQRTFRFKHLQRLEKYITANYEIIIREVIYMNKLNDEIKMNA